MRATSHDANSKAESRTTGPPILMPAAPTATSPPVAATRAQLRHIAYPVWGWTLPADDALDTIVAGGRLDIAPHLPAKRRAIAAHASQHGRLVTDDPSGFTLPPSLLSVFDAPYEVFLDVR